VAPLKRIFFFLNMSPSKAWNKYDLSKYLLPTCIKIRLYG